MPFVDGLLPSVYTILGLDTRRKKEIKSVVKAFTDGQARLSWHAEFPAPRYEITEVRDTSQFELGEAFPGTDFLNLWEMVDFAAEGDVVYTTEIC